jgi:hypothetical protein
LTTTSSGLKLSVYWKKKMLLEDTWWSRRQERMDEDVSIVSVGRILIDPGVVVVLHEEPVLISTGDTG